jgi:hypothetical protein
MPKFGLKCFLGSFICSLGAVYAATEVYLTLSAEQKNQVAVISENEPKDIELFADNEESDAIYEKLRTVNTPKTDTAVKVSDKGIKQPATAKSEVQETLPVNIEKTEEKVALQSDILYMPEDDDDDRPAVISTKPYDVADNNTQASEAVQTADNTDTLAPEDEELQIADAAEAPVYVIPLIHNYQVNPTNVAVSSQSENNRIAMASQNVSIDNLGIEQPQNDKAIIDSPWDTAETANKHITKNKLDDFNKEHQKDVAALDKNEHKEAQSDKETQVAYKMMRNQVIPIPDEIMNDENLTPQLAYSEENKKIEKALLKKKQEQAEHSPAPQNTTNAKAMTIPNIRKEKTAAEKQPAKETTKAKEKSKSLSDSIAAWFSGSDDKSADEEVSEEIAKNAERNSGTSSSFRKLLGINGGKDSNIAPTELKLFFQPNRAEISGQTLEWLHAFAENVINNENVIIEIRIDGSTAYELQKKRLNLLYTILANNNVDYDKINIIFTDREPNSFIIRNVRYATEEELLKATRKADNPWF